MKTKFVLYRSERSEELYLNAYDNIIFRIDKDRVNDVNNIPTYKLLLRSKHFNDKMRIYCNFLLHHELVLSDNIIYDHMSNIFNEVIFLDGFYFDFINKVN